MTPDALLLLAQLGPNVSLNARPFILMFSVLAACTHADAPATADGHAVGR